MRRYLPSPLELVLAAVIVALFMSAMQRAARGHDDASWIQRGGYKNSLGELCCGVRDCAEIAAVDVQVTAQGYFIRSIGETVPFHEATPSPTGTYWRCAWGGQRKCFFAPPGSS